MGAAVLSITERASETKRNEICWRFGMQGRFCEDGGARVSRGNVRVYHREPIDIVVAMWFC